MGSLKKKERGFSIGIAAFIALVISLLMVGIVQTIQYNLHQNTYLTNMERARELAESATNDVIGQLIYSPGLVPLTGTTTTYGLPGPGGEGTYDYYVTRRSTPAIDCFYITTVATRKSLLTVGTQYMSSMHTYVNISNTGDYLFAVAAGTMPISAGIIAPAGKVYAPYLDFKIGATATQVRRAEYALQVTPPGNDPSYNQSVGPIEITDAPNVPLEVPALLFPQVLDNDISNYQNDANYNNVNLLIRHDQCTFNGDIYPPGYTNALMGGDNNPNHTNVNADHVYYCAGNIQIGSATIHGQILFVSSNSITITGPIRKYGNTAPTDFPGYGAPSSSTAHEAVLITRQDVHISNTFWTSFDPNFASTQAACETIEAMIMAPGGTMIADLYKDSIGNTYDILHQHLKLNFKGSMILQTAMYNFPDVFNGPPQSGPPITWTTCYAANDPIAINAGDSAAISQSPPRSYTYDTDFKNYPPPDLPALSQVHLSLEQTLSTQ